MSKCLLLKANLRTGTYCLGFPGGSEGKASAGNAADPGSISGSGRSPGGGQGSPLQYSWGFPGGSDGKASANSAGDLGLIPGSGNSPGEGNGNPLQYSCLESSIDGGAWWATVHGVPKTRTQLSNFTFHLLSVNQKQQFLCPSNEQGESEREWGPIHDPGRCPWEPETCRNSQGLPHPSMTSTFTSHPSADLEKPALSLMSGHFSLLHALTSPWQPLMSISQRAGAGSLIQEFTTVNPGPPRSNHTHCFRHLTP